jgi:hypothetical protein
VNVNEAIRQGVKVAPLPNWKASTGKPAKKKAASPPNREFPPVGYHSINRLVH